MIQCVPYVIRNKDFLPELLILFMKQIVVNKF